MEYGLNIDFETDANNKSLELKIFFDCLLFFVFNIFPLRGLDRLSQLQFELNFGEVTCHRSPIFKASFCEYHKYCEMFGNVICEKLHI